MIHILIVDDEKAARNQIEYELREGYPGSVTISSVSNGFAALEIAEKNMPDILLADIMMPKMDGITLTRKMKEKNSDIKIILITAYADKEIVKQALKIGVDNFVEKPININELLTAVSKAEDEIKKSSQVSRINSSKVVFSLAKPDCNTEQLFSNMPYYLYQKMKQMKFQTAILKLLPVNDDVIVDQPNILSGLSDLLHEMSLEALYAFKTENVLIIHFCVDDQVDILQTETFCQTYMERKSDYYIFCCFGKIVEGMQDIYLSYNEAIVCMEQSFFRKVPGICRLQELTDNVTVTSVNLENLQLLLQENKKTEILQLLEQLHQYFQSCNNMLVIDAKNSYMDFVHQLFTFSSEYHLKFSKEYREQDIILQISNVQWLEKLHELVYALLNDLMPGAENRDKESELVNKVKTYVKTHITDQNISLEMIADYCSLSSGYVNRIFKNKTGQTLNEYIGDVRIKNALEMLMQTDDTLEHIALCAGYGSANYFYSVFKKKYGVTPAEYRNVYKI